MGENTKIEWARHTFNPFYGCQKVSPACGSCYAEAWAKRSGLVGWGPHAPRRRSSPTAWKEPLKWDKAARAAGERHSVFGPSLGDPFDNQIDPEWRCDYFDLIRATPNLIYLLLTKRPQNIIKMVDAVGLLPDNVALGTTVEDQPRADQNIPHLLAAKAAVSPLFVFLSCEPMLGSTNLAAIRAPHWALTQTMNALTGACSPSLAGIAPVGWIDWVICGGESGPNARPMHPAWARALRDQCATAGTPFFFKQWGAWHPHNFDSNLSLKGEVCVWPDSHTGAGGANDHAGAGAEMDRVGKERAWWILDGVEHKAFPPQLVSP